MSEYILIRKSTLTNIGNAIRTKKGTSALIDVPDMEGEILSISGGGSSEELKGIIANTITNYYNDEITTVGGYCLGYRQFITVDLPNLTTVGTASFISDSSLKSIRLLSLSTSGGNLFQNCTNMILADLGNTTSISVNQFYNCGSMRTLILRKSDSIVPLANVNSLGGGMRNSDARVIVPQALITQYQQETNWSVVYAENNNLFQPLEGSPYESTDYVLPTS